LVANPKLHYRLDPGEPGFATHAPASRSTQLVTAQELRNRVRLQREAIAEGRQVILAHSKFTHGKDGAFPTLRGGLTIVTSIDRSASGEGQPSLGSKPQKDQEAPVGGAEGQSGEKRATEQPSAQEVQEAKRQVAVELRKAQEALADVERTDGDRAYGDTGGSPADVSAARLRYEIAELRRAKAKLEAQDLMSRLAKLQGPVEEAVARLLDHVLGLTGRASAPSSSAPGAGQAGSAGSFSGPRPGGMLRAHAPAGLFDALV